MAGNIRPNLNIKSSALSNKRKIRTRYNAPEINITPFVDVLLVLLVVFMIASPVIVSGLNVNLPNGSENYDVKVSDLNITVTIDSLNNIYVDDSPTIFANFMEYIFSKSKGNKSASIFIRADKALNYGNVMNIVAKLSQNGYSQVVLVTDENN